MANVVFKVDGLRELGENFALLTEDMQKKAARAATRAAARLVAQAASSRAEPRRTGLLLSSVQAMRSKKESHPGLEAWAVGVPGGKLVPTYSVNAKTGKLKRSGKRYTAKGAAYYWLFLEYGTVNMPAQPFLRPALDENKGRAVDKMRDELTRQIEFSLRKMRKLSS